MTKDEAMELLELLYAVYPNFNKNGMKSFNKIWLQRLMQGDYQKTLRKTNDYIENSKFPPALADVLVPIHAPRDDGMAEAIRASEEAVRKENEDPETLKRKHELIEEMRKKLHHMEGGR